MDSIKNAVLKKSLKNVERHAVAWLFRLVPFLLLVPVIAFLGIPEIKINFWTALAVSGPLNVIATLNFVKSLQKSDISAVIPLLAFVPVFLLVTSPLILGEVPSPLGIFGVLLVVTGAYTLHVDRAVQGYLEPIKALSKSKGALLMLGNALIWSISINFSKMGVVASSPLFWTMAIHGFLALGLLPFAWKHRNKVRKGFSNNPYKLIGIGVVSTLALVSQYMAIEKALVPYVISIKRISLMLTVVWGGVFFKEKHMKERLLGTLVMLAGAVFISIAALT